MKIFVVRFRKKKIDENLMSCYQFEFGQGVIMALTCNYSVLNIFIQSEGKVFSVATNKTI